MSIASNLAPSNIVKAGHLWKQGITNSATCYAWRVLNWTLTWSRTSCETADAFYVWRQHYFVIFSGEDPSIGLYYQYRVRKRDTCCTCVRYSPPGPCRQTTRYPSFPLPCPQSDARPDKVKTLPGCRVLVSVGWSCRSGATPPCTSLLAVQLTALPPGPSVPFQARNSP